jgi:hypothetical protein
MRLSERQLGECKPHSAKQGVLLRGFWYGQTSLKK